MLVETTQLGYSETVCTPLHAWNASICAEL